MIGSLARSHLNRFRKSPEVWDWAQVATDKSGKLLGKDRKPLKRQWFRNGKRLPASFRFTGQHLKQLSADVKYEVRYDGEIAYKSDFYTKADCLAHLRIRAEVYSVACRLLAELLRPVPKLPRLSDRQQEELNIIKSLPVGVGLLGKEIEGKVRQAGYDIPDGGFRGSDFKKLKAYDVVNDPGHGHCLA